MKHTIQALVENKFGVLARVSSLFSARGYNITSLAVGETHDSGISCITIVVEAHEERILEQIKKQLYKLIDVITVFDFTGTDYIDRELFLVKLDKENDSKEVVDKLIKEYGVSVLEDAPGYYVLQICDQLKCTEEILKELKKFTIRELVRTGKIAISK